MGFRGETLQNIFPPWYHILSISVSGAFPRWLLHLMQRWVVITNITVMAGLSVHLFCSSVIFFSCSFWRVLRSKITLAAN